MNSVSAEESERSMFDSLRCGFPVLGILSLIAFTPVAFANGEAHDDAAVRVADVACGDAMAATVQAFYETVQNVDARFTQVTNSVALGTGSAASNSMTTGRVVFAKPGKMRWAYETPQPSLVVSDGATLWIYDPASKEAQRFAVTSGYLTGAALSFLLGEGDLLAEFAVSAKSCDGDVVELRLVPRGDSSYEYLLLNVARASGEVLETSVVDLFGNVTTIAFLDAKTNTAPAASIFEFEPPADAQVIDLTP